MGIFNNNLEIDLENPFKNDRLQRELEIKNLTSTFNVIGNQMVLAVNSQWGTGKTSFLKMWNQYLINQKYKAIFFNAWENDYVEEPFIAFVEEIRESINDGNNISGFIDKAKEVGFSLVKQSPKMVSKIIKEKTGFDSQEIISEDELTQIVSDKIDSYNKSKNSVVKFKEELQKIANKQFEESNKPIVIFVDELDRCRPDYAISLLERIKHFFNVQNIIFILGIDKEALSNSIRVIYGEQTDINGYLTRFIDIEYKLNDIRKADYINFIMEKYKFEEVFTNRKKLGFNDSMEYDYYEFKNIVEEYFLVFNLTLRDIEKIIVNILMILKARQNNLIYPYPLIFLCIVKRLNSSLYLKLKNGNIKISEIVKQINSGGLVIKWFEDYNLRGYIAKAFIIWLINDNEEIELMKRKVANIENNIIYKSPEHLCIQCFESIKEIRGYKVNARNIIFNEVELYENLTTMN